MKHLHTFESFLNEAKSLDLKLSTNEYPNGTDYRYRIESETINLRKVINLSTEPCCRNARAFGDNEIGFNSAADREKSLKYIQKSFDSGRNDVREFLMESQIDEDSYSIHAMTKCGQDAAQNFVDDNNIDSKKLVDYLKKNTDRLEKMRVQDIISNTGNISQKDREKFIKEFSNK